MSEHVAEYIASAILTEVTPARAFSVSPIQRSTHTHASTLSLSHTAPPLPQQNEVSSAGAAGAGELARALRAGLAATDTMSAMLGASVQHALDLPGFLQRAAWQAMHDIQVQACEAQEQAVQDGQAVLAGPADPDQAAMLALLVHAGWQRCVPSELYELAHLAQRPAAEAMTQCKLWLGSDDMQQPCIGVVDAPALAPVPCTCSQSQDHAARPVSGERGWHSGEVYPGWQEIAPAMALLVAGARPHLVVQAVRSNSPIAVPSGTLLCQVSVPGLALPCAWCAVRAALPPTMLAFPADPGLYTTWSGLQSTWTQLNAAAGMPSSSSCSSGVSSAVSSFAVQMVWLVLAGSKQGITAPRTVQPWQALHSQAQAAVPRAVQATCTAAAPAGAWGQPGPDALRTVQAPAQAAAAAAAAQHAQAQLITAYTRAQSTWIALRSSCSSLLHSVEAALAAAEDEDAQFALAMQKWQQAAFRKRPKPPKHGLKPSHSSRWRRLVGQLRAVGQQPGTATASSRLARAPGPPSKASSPSAPRTPRAVASPGEPALSFERVTAVHLTELAKSVSQLEALHAEVKQLHEDVHGHAR